jgi:hypothetical protein
MISLPNYLLALHFASNCLSALEIYFPMLGFHKYFLLSYHTFAPAHN